MQAYVAVLRAIHGRVGHARELHIAHPPTLRSPRDMQVRTMPRLSKQQNTKDKEFVWRTHQPLTYHCAKRGLDKIQCARVVHGRPCPARRTNRHTHVAGKSTSPPVSTIAVFVKRHTDGEQNRFDTVSRTFVASKYAGVPHCHVMRYNKRSTGGLRSSRHPSCHGEYTLARRGHRGLSCTALASTYCRKKAFLPAGTYVQWFGYKPAGTHLTDWM